MNGNRAGEAQFFLASASPRRRELLRQLGYHFAVAETAVPELREYAESPDAFVRRLALAKARAGQAFLGEGACQPVLGADTAVVVDDEILGKPRDAAEAARMLRVLSGRDHRVLTAVAIVQGTREDGLVSESRVWMRAISEEEVRAYAASGEGADKAGAYAVQGRAAIFVERLEGSYSGVMGLPLFETARLLARFGVDCLRG